MYESVITNREDHHPKIKTPPFSSVGLELFSDNLPLLLLRPTGQLILVCCKFLKIAAGRRDRCPTLTMFSKQTGHKRKSKHNKSGASTLRAIREAGRWGRLPQTSRSQSRVPEGEQGMQAPGPHGRAGTPGDAGRQRPSGVVTASRSRPARSPRPTSPSPPGEASLVQAPPAHLQPLRVHAPRGGPAGLRGERPPQSSSRARGSGLSRGGPTPARAPGLGWEERQARAGLEAGVGRGRAAIGCQREGAGRRCRDCGRRRGRGPGVRLRIGTRELWHSGAGKGGRTGKRPLEDRGWVSGWAGPRIWN